MDDNRIIELLTRKMAGEITIEEEEELGSLMDNNPDSIYYEEFLKELWTEKKEEWELDSQFYFSRHKRRHGKKLTFNHERSVRQERTWKGLGSKRKIRISLGLLSLVILLGCGLFWWDKIDLDSIEIVSEKGMRKQLTLPDGTKVWLNADSKIIYQAFNERTGCRKVKLTGEAYFDVKKDEKRPFLIVTHDLTIKVLGTAFNVKAYPEDEKTEATLINGAIELSLNDGTSERILLKPKEKLAVSKVRPVLGKWTNKENRIKFTLGHLSKVYVDSKELIQETSWMDNKLVFKNETLSELIPKLERWYNVNIELTNESAKDYRFTGTITNESVNQALTAMQLINFFNYKIEQHDIVIY